MAQLERILSSSVFIASPSLSQFLQFVVTETLAGRAGQIKAYTVATKAWGRERDFDPQADPIVRIQAGRLRRALHDYYADEGLAAPIRIELPKGTYVPRFTAVAAQYEETEHTPAAEIITEGPVLAVLPFHSLSSDASQDHFVDAIGDELTVYFSRFQGLAVIAYHSCRRFSNTTQSVPEIGRQLGADFLVTGTVYRDKKRLRLSVALNDAHDGLQVWAQQFDRELTAATLFDVQDEIIERIVAIIGSNYGVIPRLVAQTARAKRIDDLTVYEAVLRRADFLMNVTPEAHQEARQALEQAVETAPTYAPAWAALGGMYTNAYILGLDSPDDPLGEALICANRAIRLDPHCQEAHSVLANIYFQHRDQAGVQRVCHRSLELNPNDAAYIGTAGFWLALAGDEASGLALLDRAIKLNPFFPGWFRLPYFLHHFSRREDEQALAEAQAFNLPGLFWDALLRAAALSRLGRLAEAQAAVDDLLRLKPDFPEQADHFLSMFVMKGDLRKQILESLQEAGLSIP